MILKSTVGGRFELHKLGVSFNSGEVKDLAFYASREAILTDRELKLSIEKGFLKKASPTEAVSNFHEVFKAAPATIPSGKVIRRAIFLRKEFDKGVLGGIVNTK